MHTDNGEPGILAQMSDEGVAEMAVLAIEYCRLHPKATIYNEAAEAYRGARALEIQLGGAK